MTLWESRTRSSLGLWMNVHPFPGSAPLGDNVWVNPVPITELLNRWIAGDGTVDDELFAALYPELKVIARGKLWREGARPFQTTELVHEAFLRLKQQRNIVWQCREQLYGIASLMMRRLLVDEARTNRQPKRGGGAVRVELGEGLLVAEARSADVLALEEALERLERASPRPAAVVTMRYYGGMTMEEIATALDVSLSTVEIDWRLARARLHRELAGT